MKNAIYDFFFGSSNKITNYMYKAPHLIAIGATILLSVVLIILARKMTDKQKRTVLWVFFGLLLAFEITHRVYRFYRGQAWYDYLPLHFSSISVWVVIFATATKNKHLLNLSAISALLSSTIYLAYPGVGFNVDVLRFTNYYSIITHCLGFVYATFAISAKLVSFKFKDLWITLLYFAILLTHSALLNFVFFQGENYFYYVENLTSWRYEFYLIAYFSFLILYIISFYIISYLVNKQKTNKKMITE